MRLGAWIMGGVGKGWIVVVIVVVVVVVVDAAKGATTFKSRYKLLDKRTTERIQFRSKLFDASCQEEV